MAFEVYFHADEAMLWHVKYSLDTFPAAPSPTAPFSYLAQGAGCILCCSSALEAIVNKIFLYSNVMSKWDELRLISKIETLHELKEQKIDKGQQPWQDIQKLIKIRNWLAHNKETYIGLSGADDEWICGKVKIDIEKELKKESIEILYKSVRIAGTILSKMWGLDEDFDFLDTERYTPLYS